MFQKIAVGEKIYLWTRGGAKVSGNTACIISAHGGYSFMNSKFTVDTAKGQEFVFYAPHNYTLLDPSLFNILCGKVKANETVKAGKCQDYSLSKYQGEKHGSGREKYSDIEAAGTTEEELRKIFTQSQLDSRADKADESLDVVTIRYRRGRSDPTLFEVVTALKKWPYKTFHCSFCRGPMEPWRKEIRSWDATTENV